MVTRMSSLSVRLCVCVWVWAGVPMTCLSHAACAFSVCVCCTLSVAVLSAVRCDEVVCIAAQKAQGQHNTIPLGYVSVRLTEGLAGPSLCPPDQNQSGECCSTLPGSCAGLYCMLYFWILCMCLYMWPAVCKGGCV